MPADIDPRELLEREQARQDAQPFDELLRLDDDLLIAAVARRLERKVELRRPLSQAERDVLVLTRQHHEIIWDGAEGYVANSGDELIDSEGAFARVGMPRLGAVVRGLLALFPAPLSREPAARWAQLQALPKVEREELQARALPLIGEDVGPLCEHLASYVRAHREAFDLPPRPHSAVEAAD